MRQGAATTAYRGRTASIGFAHGPFVRVDQGANVERVAGTLVDEALALRNAIETASRQIAELAAIAGGEAAQILEFQVALLEDEDFIAAIFASIGEGKPADAAWRSALDEQIAEYNSTPDEYLKARSSDLADLRDRVLNVLRGDEGQSLKIPDGAVVCAEDLPPSRFLEIDWSGGGGLALLRGSPTSHVAMLARARGIPMVVQLGTIPDSGTTALLDGEGATLELDPGTEQIGQFEKRRDLHRKSRASARAILRRPAASWRGERIKLHINIQGVEDLEHADAQYADGVGLMRTEFLLANHGLPDEETQFQTYDAVLRWADRRPVTIRTFDAGGDKPLPGFTSDGEANPFLGVRTSSLSCPAGDICRPVACACACRSARKSQGHVSDGYFGGGAGGRAEVVYRRRAELACKGCSRDDSRARNHGRGAGGGVGHRELQGCLLFNWFKRPRTICPCLRSLEWGSCALDGSAASGSS